MEPFDPNSILHLIQAAIAPVVLISGVGLLLLTLSNRLGRIVDRTRIVASERVQAVEAARTDFDAQLTILGRRARMIRLALALSASAVGITGLLIATLFLAMLLGWNATLLCTGLFVTALLCVVSAMWVFVAELRISLTALDVVVGEPFSEQRL
jgi:hypothetical protein